MPNAMNDFFVNIGNIVEQSHLLKIICTYYHNDPNPDTIFLKLVTLEETIASIAQSNRSKACGPNSIPTNLLIINMLILADPLTMILNKSMVEGVFRSFLL